MEVGSGFGPKWAKHFGAAHPSIKQYEASILQVQTVEREAVNALMCGILRAQILSQSK